MWCCTTSACTTGASRKPFERGDSAAYLREMRRAYGEAGSFVVAQVRRARSAARMLPALFPLKREAAARSVARRDRPDQSTWWRG
jgi:hypothetical protein